MPDSPVFNDTFFTWSLAGGWQPNDIPLPDGIAINTLLLERGYAPSDFHDMDYVPGGFALWTHTTETEPHRYVVIIELPDSSVAWVFLEGVPTLMDYLRLYTTPSLVSLLAYQLGTVTTMIEKAFRAWHGHSQDGMCYDCDPDGMKAHAIRRQQMAARKAAKESLP